MALSSCTRFSLLGDLSSPSMNPNYWSNGLTQCLINSVNAVHNAAQLLHLFTLSTVPKMTLTAYK